MNTLTNLKTIVDGNKKKTRRIALPPLTEEQVQQTLRDAIAILEEIPAAEDGSFLLPGRWLVVNEYGDYGGGFYTLGPVKNWDTKKKAVLADDEWVNYVDIVCACKTEAEANKVRDEMEDEATED